MVTRRKAGSAESAEITKETQRQIIQLQELGWYHSIELPNGEIIEGFQSVTQLRQRLKQFPIPENLAGKRVLDIGAWDGWFSFEMERRGASVLAVDLVRNEKILKARQLLGSQIEYAVIDVYDLNPSKLGKFDVVLFFGVLYHLKHPLLALERVSALATDLVCIESYVTDNGSEATERPTLEFYETTELRGQFDNWCGPNTACLLSFCRTAGFARVKLESVLDNRAHVTCYRQWDGVVPKAEADDEAPYISCVENAVSRDHSFSTEKDEYVSLWFKSPQQHSPPLRVDEVFPEIGPYAAPPAVIRPVGSDGWQAIVKMPPGLEPGWTPVRMRIRGSGYSNTVTVGVGLSTGDAQQRQDRSQKRTDVKIEGVTDGKTWEANRVRVGGINPAVSVWISGLLSPVNPCHISVRLLGHDLPVTFVSSPDSMGFVQLNAMLPGGIAPQRATVCVAVEDFVTQAVEVELVSESEIPLPPFCE